jgi:hypothetical protein
MVHDVGFDTDPSRPRRARVDPVAMQPAARTRLRLATIAFACVVTSGCGGSDEPATSSQRPAGERDVPRPRLALVGRFDAPVHVLPVPGTDLVAVVEKGGRVLVADGLRCPDPTSCPKRPVTSGSTIIDLRDDVSSGSEQGLLGMAFHPDWPKDPRVFVDYTDVDGDTHVEAWRLDAPTARGTRERELLRVDQPFANHNGGHLAFGPDRLLYIAMGDGGDAGDPGDRAQQVDERLGKLLRIDVDAGGERGYGIPKHNVAGGAPEVWAIGLRNPWRFSFDAKTGDLWIGDVGQGDREEIDVVAREALDGRTPNFGWRRREGFRRFDTSGTTGPGPLLDPVLDYSHDDGCSITGGVVYRGRLAAALRGWYLFADFCDDDLRLLDADGVPRQRFKPGELHWSSVSGTPQVASIAEIQHDEVLVVSLAGGVYQVVSAT